MPTVLHIMPQRVLAHYSDIMLEVLCTLSRLPCAASLSSAAPCCGADRPSAAAHAHDAPLHALAAGIRRQHSQAPNYLAVTTAGAPAQPGTRTHNHSCIHSCLTLIRSNQSTKHFIGYSLENYRPTKRRTTKTTRSGARDPTETSNKQTHNGTSRARNDLLSRPPTHPANQ